MADSKFNRLYDWLVAASKKVSAVATVSQISVENLLQPRRLYIPFPDCIWRIEELLEDGTSAVSEAAPIQRKE